MMLCFVQIWSGKLRAPRTSDLGVPPYPEVVSQADCFVRGILFVCETYAPVWSLPIQRARHLVASVGATSSLLRWSPWPCRLAPGTLTAGWLRHLQAASGVYSIERADALAAGRGKWPLARLLCQADMALLPRPKLVGSRARAPIPCPPSVSGSNVAREQEEEVRR